MTQSRTTWLAFAVCLLIGAAAVGYLTHSALELEQREAAGVIQAESERLALWRMESLLVPLLAKENARSPLSYQSFYPAQSAYSKLLAPIGKGEVVVPSPLLTFKSDYIRLHFELQSPNDDSQQVTQKSQAAQQMVAGPAYCSPQVPVGNQRDLCELYVTSPEELQQREVVMAEFTRCVPTESILNCAKALPAEFTPVEQQQVQWVQSEVDDPFFNSNYGNTPRKQQARGVNELSKRNRANVMTNSAQQAMVLGPPSVVKDKQPPVPPMTPLWINEELVLLRRVQIDGREVTQGCWLDWTATEEWLCGEIEDLLPHAQLRRTKTPLTTTEQPVKLEELNALRLASLPVELKPGVAAETAIAGLTPMRLSLGTAWLCLVIASIAAGLLLFAALRMSQRRGAFVSAVTHELRTPLTTFRVYTDLLGDERQKDQEKRASYVQTLRRQAERLDHLVDNVLSYARLENKSLEARAEDIKVSDLLQRVEPTLRDLADQAEMKFTQSCRGDEMTVRVDPEAVERILFNLVDNACKYGVGTDRREIELTCECVGSHGVIRVRDYGRGVRPADRGTLFQAFTKSAAEAAKSAPGVGLGLSLSRRLARCMRGDLILEKHVTDGACFALSLPSSH